ncbi:MAG: TIGR02646 family protein [Thiomargarita sp.]|nr:TIGR02646 family protein [Thiomargarita sp.]
MVELQHGNIPNVLIQYIKQNPSATHDDFDSIEFNKLKLTIKTQLHQDQGGICVYCEQNLGATDGQIEHIKPKKGKNACPNLCFQYTNYAHSCINAQTCGQKKKNGILPIEPTIGCNNQFSLLTDGHIEPVNDLTKNEKHIVKQTRDMLGLNNSALVRTRQKWVATLSSMMQRDPSKDISSWLQDKQFRYILKRM